MISHPPSLASEIDAALAFWRAAGVDCDFADDARAWLTEAAPPLADAPTAPLPPASAASRAEAVDGAAPRGARPGAALPQRRDFWGDSPPASLDAFRHWWLNAPELGAGSYPRIAPRGNPGAPLMVLVPDPESGDSDALLGGPQGRLLARIIAAMGLAPEDCYLASALPRHTPMADLASLAASGMDRVTAHHIALAAPQRVVAFGQGLGALLAGAKGGEDQSLREINQTGISLPVMVTETLGSMLDMPRLKARFWRRWMEWSA
jgi:DNA polymerase